MLCRSGSGSAWHRRSLVSAAALMRLAEMYAAPTTHGHDIPIEEVLCDLRHLQRF